MRPASCLRDVLAAISVGIVVPSFADPPLIAETEKLTVSGQIDLQRLIDLAAERLKVTVEYDAATIKGSVTIRSTSELSPLELWDFMNRAVVARGFVTVQNEAAKTGAGGAWPARAHSVVKVGDVQPSTPQAGYASILVGVLR